MGNVNEKRVYKSDCYGYLWQNNHFPSYNCQKSHLFTNNVESFNFGSSQAACERGRVSLNAKYSALVPACPCAAAGLRQKTRTVCRGVETAPCVR